MSDFIITGQSREWVEYYGSMVPMWATALFPPDSGYVPVSVYAYKVGYDFPTRDALPRLATFHVDGGLTRSEFAAIDPFALMEIVLTHWLEDPKYKVAPKKVELGFSSRELLGKAQDIVRQLELAEVARVYLLSPRRGTTNVMDQLGYGSKTTAIRRVMEARRAGLIPPANSTPEDFAKAFEALQDGQK